MYIFEFSSLHRYFDIYVYLHMSILFLTQVIVSFQALSGQNIEDDKIVIRDCLGSKGFEVTDLSGD